MVSVINKERLWKMAVPRLWGKRHHGKFFASQSRHKPSFTISGRMLGKSKLAKMVVRFFTRRPLLLPQVLQIHGYTTARALTALSMCIAMHDSGNRPLFFRTLRVLWRWGRILTVLAGSTMGEGGIQCVCY